MKTVFGDTKYVQAQVSATVHREIRIFCMDKGVSINDLLSEVITEWVNKNLIQKEEHNGQEENGKEN